MCLFAGCSGSGNVTPENSAPSQNPGQAETPIPEYTDANAALADGSRLLDNGETDKAINVLNQAVKLNPDLAEAYFKLGIAHALVEKRQQTSEVVDETTPTPTPKGKKPEAAKTESEKAFEKAVAAYKKILDANEDDDNAHFNLGRAYNKLNEDEDAAKELKQAVKLKPDDTEYQTELGAIMIKLAKYDEAISPLKKALELDPENSRAQDLLDDAEAGKKRVDFAAKAAADAKKQAKTSSSSSTSTDDEEGPGDGTAKPAPSPQASPPAKPKSSPPKPGA